LRRRKQRDGEKHPPAQISFYFSWPEILSRAARAQASSAQYTHRAVTGIRHKCAIRKRDIRNALRLAQPGDLAQYLARCQINHAEAVVDELSNKQPLSLQIDAEVIDSAAHLPERYLCLEYERWARRLSTGRGGPDEARRQKDRHPNTLSSSRY
jgi:hypothetical protein